MKRVSLRRLKAEVLPQLPVKSWRNLRVAIDKETRRLCDAAFTELKKMGLDLNHAMDLAKATAVRGAAFEALSQARKALAAVKTPYALELIQNLEEEEEPVVVFASHRAPIDLIGAREGWAAITGDTSDSSRKLIASAFQAGELKGIALTIQAGGTALTLTRASQMIFIDRAWTPALNEQAEDRCLRIGQSRGVLVTILEAAHAIDYRVNELLGVKSTLAKATLGE
jgi:SNF2 family DNA or RNA helicase